MKKTRSKYLTQKGKFKTLGQILESSKKWVWETWTEYAKELAKQQVTDQRLWNIYLQRIKAPLKENDINKKTYEFLISKEALKNYLSSQREEKSKKDPWFYKYKEDLPIAMKILSKIEDAIIRGIFWEEKTESQLAREMKVSCIFISNYKKEAMKKIKDCLLEIEKERRMAA